MANKLALARQKLAVQILNDFKGRITGDTVNYVIGDNPENMFFVGKLLTNKASNNKSSYSSDVFIESVGADFYIDENEFNTASLQIYPKGDFYYRAYPTLEQQRDAFLEEVNEIFEEQYVDFDALIRAYQANPQYFKKVKIKLIPVYKKTQIHKNSISVGISLAQLYDPTLNYGGIGESDEPNLLLQDSLSILQEELDNDEYRYKYVIHEQTTIQDLLSEESYKRFLETKAKQDVIIHQNWNVYIDVKIKKIKEKYLITVSLVNASSVQSNDQSHQSNKKEKDKTSIETLFNSGLEIVLVGAHYSPIVLDYFIDDYKYNKEQQAVGSNCSVVFDKDRNSITTEHLPTFVQKRLLTNDKLAVKFKDLIDAPVQVLTEIKAKMVSELNSWKLDFKVRKDSLTEKGASKMLEEIGEFEREIKRFQFGIDIIRDYPMVLNSFILMNQAFMQTSKKYDTWRLFQIVYIVSIIPDIVACDENLMSDDEKEKTTLGCVSLLYFPTGGGKTEAFLGVLVFNLFFDRYRGKECGVTSILRYPLRLLSVQQVQRLANTLAQAELIRRSIPAISQTEEFSLGYFVGDNNTPNKIGRDDVNSYRNMGQSEKDEGRIIDICPFCGKNSVHLNFDEETYRLVHYCDNPECPSGKTLPIYMVDSEIYRYLPSAIISTVDKLAILGNNPSFRNILSGAPMRCPKHGFTSSRRCLVDKEFCNVEVQSFERVEMYDPAPTLFIQDELHLIRESLGTYASHYESFVDYFVQNISKSKRKIKTIGATATISSYESQITQLYSKDPLRFPCASPYSNKNFYSFIDESDTQRLILGYAPYGKAIINSVVYSLKYMRQVVHKYFVNPQKVLEIPEIGIDSMQDALKILEDYWIFLEYNNVKRDGNNVEGALETPINVELQKEGIVPFNTRKMTGDETFQDVREVLAQVENMTDVYNGVNLIAATSMISHGVDADRFNIMFFYGMPGNTAEYIQAYSRTGRKHSSIVIDIMRPSRETDQSYLKNFVKFHEFKDIMVEAVPINRWATKAIDGTLPGIFAGLLLNQYDPELQYSIGSLFFMKNIKKAIVAGDLDRDTIKNELYRAYGCVTNGEVVELGNQYRESINRFVENFFDSIIDRNWIDENIFSGFSALGYRIMNSLRDTDTPLIIELE